MGKTRRTSKPSQHLYSSQNIYSAATAHLDDVLVVAKVASIHSRALCAKARIIHLVDLQASLQDLTGQRVQQLELSAHQDLITSHKNC